MPKLGSCFVFLIVTMCFCGCSTKMNRPDPENGFSTEYPMSAAEYSIYLTQESASLTNILLTRITIGQSIMNGTENIETEITNTESALEKITYIRESLSTTMPADYYSDEYTNMVRLSKEAYDSIKEYLECLKNGSDITSAVEKMQGCYSEIGGEPNLIYK